MVRAISWLVIKTGSFLDKGRVRSARGATRRGYGSSGRGLKSSAACSLSFNFLDYFHSALKGSLVQTRIVFRHMLPVADPMGDTWSGILQEAAAARIELSPVRRSDPKAKLAVLQDAGVAGSAVP